MLKKKLEELRKKGKIKEERWRKEKKEMWDYIKELESRIEELIENMDKGNSEEGTGDEKKYRRNQNQIGKDTKRR